MTDTLPPPMVPPDADLTDFKFMPLEVARLRRSKAWLICKRRPELAFFMLNLWSASWHERPAGSLEDDDDVLADAAMCSPERWQKVRAEVMRGWVKCSDGRLYHPVVAEKVMDSWHGKAVARWRKECDRIRKENHKRKENQQPTLPFPPEPRRAGDPIPPESPPFPAESGGIPAENALKGRERKGRDKEREKKESLTVTSARAPRGPAESKGERLPVGWGPSDELRQWTRDTIREAASSVDPRAELAKFIDYWNGQPGAKGRKADWPGTWRNWIRKAIEIEGKTNGRQGTHNTRRPGASRRAGDITNARLAALIGGDLAGTDEPRDGEAEPRVVGSAVLDG